MSLLLSSSFFISILLRSGHHISLYIYLFLNVYAPFHVERSSQPNFFLPFCCAIPFLLFFIIQKNHWGLMGFLIRLIRNEQRRVRAHTRFRMPSETWSGEDDRISHFCFSCGAHQILFATAIFLLLL